MRIRIVLALVFTQALSAATVADDFAARRDYNWHQWRGPSAGGVAPYGDPPVTWDEQTNIKWKVALPGEGSGTPVIWEDRIFITAAIKTDRIAESPPKPDASAKTSPPGNYYQFVVLCLDRASGKIVWQRVACEEVPHEGRHPTNSYASASPTTDGKRLYVSFGSRGICCYDLTGELLWKRDLGDTRTRYGWGEAITPVIHGESLVINWDHEDDSFITVLDAKTGETRWKNDRDEPTSWATPLVVEHDGVTQAIVNGTNRVRSYDLATGRIIWQCGGQTVNAIPSPILLGNVVYCMSGYRGSAAFALPLSATGDLTDSNKIIWHHDRSTPYVPSPINYGKHMYFTASNNGILSCLDAETGKPIFGPVRMPGITSLYASPAAASDRIYFTGRDGTTLVIKHAKQLEAIATNRLNDPMDASPAIVGKQIFLRGAKHLYCVE